MFVGIVSVRSVCCCGSHCWRVFWFRGLVASIRCWSLWVGSLAMSTEALRVPSLVLAVMFRACARFMPTMALWGSMTKLVVVSDSQW